MWPILLDYTEEESRKILRRLELEAYGSLVSALRAQGSLTSEKLKLLKETASALHITPERHRAEIRRAVNDEQLCTIAQYSEGTDTYHEWSAEGRRKIRLVPRAVPQTAFLTVARRVADVAQADNAKMPSPAATVRATPRPAPPLTKFEQEERPPAKKRRRSSQDSIPSASYGPSPAKPRIQKHGVAKIHHVYKNQSRTTLRQNQPITSSPSMMPPPKGTIKTLGPIKQRATIVNDIKTPKESINNDQFKPQQHIATTLYSTNNKSIPPAVTSAAKVTAGVIKLPQSQNQKLVIVSAAQKTIPTTAIASSVPAATAILNSMNTIKTKIPFTSDDDMIQTKPTKLLTSQVIVSKSQLTPLPTLSMTDKPKVLTVQAKVRPQGSIIVPLQSQTTSNNNQFAGVSVPVLQGVQWKTIQGKSTVKLLPLTANAKIIQKQIGSITTSLANTVTSGPIYVMNKPGNIIVNKTTHSESNDKNLTHIRPITTQPIKTDDKVLLVRRPSITTTNITVDNSNTKSIQETSEEFNEERKSNVLQDALLASGVTSIDDDIETQISQYAIRKTNSITNNTTPDTVCINTSNNFENKSKKQPQKEPETHPKPIQQIVVNRPIQNIQLQDTKFLTLEEAVALLGDTSETRALLNNLHVDNPPVTTDSMPTIITTTEEETSGQLDPQTGIYSSRDKNHEIEIGLEKTNKCEPDSFIVEESSERVIETVDIFSKALASADIHLDQNTTEEYFVDHETEVLTVPRAVTEETINEIIIEEASTTEIITETEDVR